MTKELYTKAQAAWVEMVNLKPGNFVEVCRISEYGEYGWNDYWLPEMTLRVGETVEVRSISPGGIFTHDGFKYPFFILEKVQVDLPSKIHISDEYHVEFKADGGIKVGCQEIPFNLLEKIYETAKSIG